MEEESGLFQTAFEALQTENLSAPELLRAGAMFSYYRLSHDGKYFFFKTYTSDTNMARRLLRREYELASGCDNPGIVHVFLHGEFIPGKEGILSEYIDGRTLTEFIAENPSRAVRRKVFEQLLQTVAYLHRRGIIHNDIKPDNILISRNGDTLKLIDFGLSDDDAHYLIKAPGCTDAYASPELKNHRKADVRSDIYSIGKIMSALFGSRFGRIARKATNPDPKKRYGGVEAMQKAWRRRKRPLKIAAGAAGLAIAGAFAFFFLSAWKADRLKTAELEKELQRQNIEIAQREEAHKSLQTAYGSLTDSLRHATELEARHQQAIKKRIETFKEGIENRLGMAERELRKAKNLREAIAIRQSYVESIRTFFDQFDKTVDGEDLAAALSSIMIASFSESDRRLNAIQQHVPFE